MKTFHFCLLASCLLASTFLAAQTTNNLQTPTSVNTDGAVPDASAILDVQSATKGMLVPRMTSAQRTAIASPATGLLVFDTDSGGFWFFDGTAWADLSAKLADADGDTKIQVEETPDEDFIRFDAAGSERLKLTPDSSVFNGLLKQHDGGLLLLGITGATPIAGAGARLMWIPEKRAFRAGEVDGGHWDDANIGLNSFVGGGFDNTASGERSFIGGGIFSTASGIESFVGGGSFNNASGTVSFIGGGAGNTASGLESFVGAGVNNTASGDRSFTGGGNDLFAKSFSEAAFGTFNTDYAPISINSFEAADRLFVIGNGPDNDNRSNAVTVLKSGSVGIGTETPDALVDIEGGALLAQGTTGGTPVSGAGTRLMWIPEKAACRAGKVTGNKWDNTNIGDNSFVGGGQDNKASGSGSFVGGGFNNTALNNLSFVGGGGENIASGNSSFAGGGALNTASGGYSFVGGGVNNTASGDNSFTAGGASNTASDFYSFVGGGFQNTASGREAFIGGGRGLLAKSYSEAVFGTYNTDYAPLSTTGINAADRLFVIGNGTSTSARSNAVTVLKSGSVGIGTETPDALVDIEGGALLAQGTTGATPVSGAGTRLMWIPAKKAFRAGEVFATQWDDANIGLNSFVGGGINNTASGIRSFIGGGLSNTASNFNSFVGGGLDNTASGYNSFVGGGSDNTASGSRSFVGGGGDNTASGSRSFVGVGSGALAESYSEAVFGTYNTDYTPISTTDINAADRLFVIGNGTSTSARSNAVTVLKSGKVGIGTDMPKNSLDVEGGIAIGTTYSGTNTAPANGAIIQGNVGIGTASPDLRLHIVGGTDVSPTSGGYFQTGSTGGLNIAMDDNEIMARNNGAISPLYLNNEGGNVIINSANATGNVGIGIGTPVERLHIKGSAQLDGPNGNRNSIVGTPTGLPDNGAVVVYNSAGASKAGIYVDGSGMGVVFGDVKAFVMQHPEQPGKNIWYASLEGPEAGAYERGTAVLQNGEAFVPFSDHYRLVANAETMTVLLTPTEWDTYGLAVVEKTATGFRVKELKGGTGNFAFDWEVKCVRKGFEDYEVVRDKRELQFGNSEEK